MSSTERVFSILDLFSKDKPIWTPDQINDKLGYTRTTGYRYVKELVDLGMLQKIGAGLYALGPRIIELDYQLRQSDPVLLVSAPLMDGLASETGYDAVFSVLFTNDNKVIDTYRSSVQPSLNLSHGRGRPRTLFRSGASKILLAHLSRSKILKFYDSNKDAIAENQLGDSINGFRSYLSKIRSQGFYFSEGELDSNIGAIAIPIENADGDTVAALALVGELSTMQHDDIANLKNKMNLVANKIVNQLQQMY